MIEPLESMNEGGTGEGGGKDRVDLVSQSRRDERQKEKKGTNEDTGTHGGQEEWFRREVGVRRSGSRDEADGTG